MEEHLRFAVCYWHTFCADGGDPFGPGTRAHPWGGSSDKMVNARSKIDAAFEFFTKLDVPFYCFHDRDIAPEGDSVAESEANLTGTGGHGERTPGCNWHAIAVGHGQRVLSTRAT